MTDQELIRLQGYNLKDIKELSLSQLQDYQDLLNKQLNDIYDELRWYKK